MGDLYQKITKIVAGSVQSIFLGTLQHTATFSIRPQGTSDGWRLFAKASAKSMEPFAFFLIFCGTYKIS
jgi:hypothetical protein